jgi:hypothetical protein
MGHVLCIKSTCSPAAVNRRAATGSNEHRRAANYRKEAARCQLKSKLRSTPHFSPAGPFARRDTEERIEADDPIYALGDVAVDGTPLANKQMDREIYGR